MTLIQNTWKFKMIMHSDTLRIVFLQRKRLVSQIKASEFSAKGN